MALMAAIGRVGPGARLREAWESAGVAYDDITGGLTILGLAPEGWSVPPDSPLTLPPRVLAGCTWPCSDGGAVFVTENPSVLSAATELPGARIVCTSGTPSRIEVTALGRLAAAGWNLHVRADFDDAGITHTSAILAEAPTARPWRMSSSDYLGALDAGGSASRLRLDRLGVTPWDPGLASVMAARGVAVYEEALLDLLLDDLRATSVLDGAGPAPGSGGLS